MEEGRQTILNRLPVVMRLVLSIVDCLRGAASDERRKAEESKDSEELEFHRSLLSNAWASGEHQP